LENKPSRPQLNPYLKFSGLAFELLAALALGWWAGSRLDAWLQTDKPVGTLACMMLCLLASLYHVIRSLTNQQP
jgi:F0F1-type ATP synthase assembly protein I